MFATGISPTEQFIKEQQNMFSVLIFSSKAYRQYFIHRIGKNFSFSNSVPYWFLVFLMCHILKNFFNSHQMCMSSLISPQSKTSWKCAEKGKKELKLVTSYTSLS